MMNVGTTPAVLSPASSQLVGGKARRRLMPPGWDVGAVVVRGRESRPHGEGPQRDRSRSAEGGGPGEYRGAVARPRRGRKAGTPDADEAAPMGGNHPQQRHDLGESRMR